MKKILFLIAAITATSHTIAYSQQHIVTYYDRFKKFKEEDYYLDAQAQKHGKSTTYFTDGSLKEVDNYVHGKVNGVCTLYHNDIYSRGISVIANFKNDQREGLQKFYYDTNPETPRKYVSYVKTEEFYKNDELVWRKVYDGSISRRYLIKEELLIDGLTKGFLPNGHQCYQIAANGMNFQDGNNQGNKIIFTAKDGKKEGLYREWYSNGQIADSCYYSNGVEDGAETKWDADGKKTISHYTRGKKNGVENQWHSNGILLASITYVDGLANGKVDVYDSTGKLSNTENYDNGERLPSLTDVRVVIQLLRMGEYTSAHNLLETLEGKMDIGFDSAMVALKLFMNYYKIDHWGYCQNLFAWIDQKHSDKLTPDDYIMFSNYKKRDDKFERDGIIDLGFKRFPLNSAIQFMYAHNLHVRAKDGMYRDDSYQFYEMWLLDLKNPVKVDELSEARDVIAEHYIRMLSPSDCNTTTSASIIQKFRMNLEIIKKFNVSTESNEREIANYEKDCNDRKR